MPETIDLLQVDAATQYAKAVPEKDLVAVEIRELLSVAHSSTPIAFRNHSEVDLPAACNEQALTVGVIEAARDASSSGAFARFRKAQGNRSRFFSFGSGAIVGIVCFLLLAAPIVVGLILKPRKMRPLPKDSPFTGDDEIEFNDKWKSMGGTLPDDFR